MEREYENTNPCNQMNLNRKLVHLSTALIMGLTLAACSKHEVNNEKAPALEVTVTELKSDILEDLNSESNGPTEQEVKGIILSTIGVSENEVNFFEAPNNMIGIARTTKSGKQMVFYASKDGSYLFSGVVVDTKSKENLSVSHVEKFAPEVDHTELVKQIKESAALVTFGDENAENEFYVFVDPKCPYCHKAYDAFEELIAAGESVKVSYLPIGILQPQSKNMAMGVLGLPEGEQIEGFRKIMQKIPYAPQATAMSKGSQLHDNNLMLFKSYELSSVPVVISKLKGAKPSMRTGYIRPKQLFGMLEQNRSKIVGAIGTK